MLQSADLMRLSTWELKPNSRNQKPRSEFNVVSRELHTARRLPALHWWTGSYAPFRSTVTQHSMQLTSRSRPCESKMVFGSGSLICIGSGSTVPCGEPQCLIATYFLQFRWDRKGSRWTLFHMWCDQSERLWNRLNYYFFLIYSVWFSKLPFPIDPV